MKLSKLSNQKNVISKEDMNVTFGGYTVHGTGCSWSGGSRSDCTDGYYDY